MDVGPSIHLALHVPPYAPLHLCPLLRCPEVVDTPEEAALPPPPAATSPDGTSPLGKIGPADRDPPPDPVEQVRAMNWFHVTNLGTLLDVLA